MASLFEVFPRKIIALVAVPLILGLLLLLLLFDLGPTAWALVMIVILAAFGVVALLIVRMLLLEKEQEATIEGK